MTTKIMLHEIMWLGTLVSNVTASHCNLAHLGHKNLIFEYFNCSFVNFLMGVAAIW